MKLYRVEEVSEDSKSLGFQWFRTMREAKKFVSTLPDEHPKYIDTAEFKTTKAGIIGLLYVYATHPDNG